MSVIPTVPIATKEVIYPSSDGKRMAENTTQGRWIHLVAGNLCALFDDNPQVFVAWDLLWYPVNDEPSINLAPDVMVVFGRPKGDRPCWIQFKENNLPPQVVFEILSPSNTPEEMEHKFNFYDEHGVEEYYVYNPDTTLLEIYQRGKSTLVRQRPGHNWVSPLMNIRFEWIGDGNELKLRYPDGSPFLTFQESKRDLRQEQKNSQRIADQLKKSEEQRRLAEEQRKTIEAERAILAAKLRELGIDPDSLK